MSQHHDPTDRRTQGGAHEVSAQGAGHHEQQRSTIPPPGDEEIVMRAAPDDRVVAGARDVKGFDIPATIAGALAALGTLLLLSSLLGLVGAIGYQADVEGQDLSIGGVIAGLIALFLACLVGGWVAGRMARRKGPLHGLVAALWLVLLAALLGVLAAVGGDKFDVTELVGLPRWFDSDALGPIAILTGLLALALMLLGGWLGGRLGSKHHHGASPVEVVERRRAVRERPGGIIGGEER